jgi:hypothetical protein
MNLHELAEERSLAIHRMVADRLRENPQLIEAARSRVAGWLADGSVHPAYAKAWAELLSGPAQRLLATLVDPGETARALRQCSPFAGVVDPRTRWGIWRAVRDGFGA